MADDPTLDMVCGSRFLTEDYRYPAPISRRTGIHIFAFSVSRIVGQRVSDPTSGFRLYNRRGDRAVRPRLPARLPRGRGGPDAPPPPPADARGAGAHVHARRRRSRRSARASRVYYMVKVLLAHLRRPRAQRRSPSPATTRPVAADAGHLMERPDPDRRDPRRAVAAVRVVLELVRRRRLLERYALLWLLSAVVLLGLAVWRGRARVIARAHRHRLPAERPVLRGRSAFVLLLLLHFSLAVSRLSDQSKVLAQRLALLEERIGTRAADDSPRDRRAVARRRSRAMSACAGASPMSRAPSRAFRGRCSTSNAAERPNLRRRLRSRTCGSTGSLLGSHSRSVTTRARWTGSTTARSTGSTPPSPPGDRGYVCVAAVHTVMACQEDPELRAAVLGADFTVPDGQPLVWAMNALGHDLPDRVYGPGADGPAPAPAPPRTGQRFYLYGGRNQGALAAARARRCACATPACRSSAATRRRSGRSPTPRRRRSSPTSTAPAPTSSGSASACPSRRSGWRGCATGSTRPC